ncbi:MAG: RNase adapter RapZ, partial [Elusimicrobiota bacterium]
MAAFDNKKVSIVIITGLSGAGKSVAIKSIEDFGGFCVDNMPPELITKFVKLIKTSDYSHKLVALGIDLRTGEFMPSLFENLRKTEKMGYKSRIIFLRAEEKTIIRRYKTSRRRHPLSAKKEELKESIRRESRALEPLRERSDVIIDTDGLNPHELKC